MKHLYKISFVAALLLTMAVNSVQAQLVVNYQNKKGAPETTQANSLNVVKEGLSFLINGLIDISQINYIARFISNDTNEGKVEIPEEAEIKPEDITIIADAEEVTVDEDGNFQTTSNNLVAVNPEGQMLYRTIVSLEEGEQMRNADLNAKETAVSMLLPMFSSIFQGMPDDAMAQMKRLIAELPETDEMAKAIDRSIVKNKYLNMDDIESEFDAAVKKVASLSGLKESVNSSRRAAALRAAAADVSIDVKSLTKAEVTVKGDLLVFLKKNRTVKGVKGVFDVWNKNRLSYSAVKVGRKMLDGRMDIVNYDSYGCRVLSPVRISRFVDSNTTWADIKAFITGSNVSGGSEYEETMISDVALDLSTNEDVVMIAGPKDDSFMQLYNVTRTNMAIVVSDIINILKNGGNEVQDQFYYDFISYLYSYDNWDEKIVDPNDAKKTYSQYLSFFKDVYGSEDLSAKEKFASIFKVTFPLLQKFIKEGAETVESEQTKALLKQMDTEAAEKVFNNFDLYYALISAYGENTLGSLGLEEGNTGLVIDGLGIVQPKPSTNEIIDEMEQVYDLYIKYGCKGGDYAIASDFFYKLQMYTGTHPTLDTQATGWDQDWNKQNYSSLSSDLLSSFDTPSYMIGFINEFLADLQVTPNTTLEAEARALRGSLYIYLAQNWGRVPLRVAGETPINIQNKEYPASDDEMWDFIIEDLKFAADKLSWQPRDNKLGRCTKGMALAYLAEAYLWKAYKNGYDKENIQLAASALKQIIDSGYYELAPSYSTLWDGDIQWPKEAIWQFANEMDPDPALGAWSRNDWNYNAFYAANPFCGGWGSEFLSWELYFLFEQGDKRRDASLCTLPVDALPQAYRSGYCYGRNPYTQETIAPSKGYFYDRGEGHAPGVWSTKLWRLKRASWYGNSSYSPVHHYFKRYAGILMDYAECLFRLNGGDDADAWAILDQIRHRAYGEMEANLVDQDHIGYFNKLADYYANAWSDPSKQITEYPVPFTRQPVNVEDAKSYYTRMTKEGLKVNNETLCKPFQGKAEVWQVALGQERRKEFNSEWCLKADLQRLGFMEAHMECNYPKGVGSANPSTTEWHTYRNWNFDVKKLLLPIPEKELERNEYAIQNPGY
ncbi:MAG: RagB/SusD family nutrient uptake outer membrane protein [Prevotella sp.]|nr:RagB/SusD family nutrient uptake outer membrane protein [Prevotella sp.]